MGIRLISFFLLLGIVTIMSCASSGTASKKSKADREHYEDISVYRPDYKDALDTLSTDETINENIIIEDVEPEYDVTTEVNQLLDSINILKKDINYIEGYTIQVYTGIKKDEANEAKAKVYTTLPDSRPVITYEQPNFKVKVGKFYTRREALRTFAELRKVLPSAIIIPEKIPVDTDE